MLQIFGPEFLITSSLVIGLINLITPFTSKGDSNLRTILLVLVGILFFVNVLIIDSLYLNGIRVNFTLFRIEKYSLCLHFEPLGLLFLTLLSSLWIFAILYTVKFLKINNIRP